MCRRRGDFTFLETRRRIEYGYTVFSQSWRNPMKMLVRLIVVVALSMTAAPMVAPPRGPEAGPDRDLAKPNYDLASRWTSAKDRQMVFSTAVTPHWLEFSDRFSYSYETPAGMKWWIV